MKINVPFYKQTNALNCGPTVLRMALAYFGTDQTIDELETKTNIKDGKGIYTIQLATVAASLRHRTSFFSKHIGFNLEHNQHAFYQQHSDMTDEQSRTWIADAKRARVVIEEKILSLDEVLQFITQGTVPIVLVDWNVVTSKQHNGYYGHFVPIVGFDESYVYVHNPGLNDAQENMPILRETFDNARTADGTDEDVVVVGKKK